MMTDNMAYTFWQRNPGNVTWQLRRFWHKKVDQSVLKKKKTNKTLKITFKEQNSSLLSLVLLFREMKCWYANVCVYLSNAHTHTRAHAHKHTHTRMCICANICICLYFSGKFHLKYTRVFQKVFSLTKRE